MGCTVLFTEDRPRYLDSFPRVCQFLVVFLTGVLLMPLLPFMGKLHFIDTSRVLDEANELRITVCKGCLNVHNVSFCFGSIHIETQHSTGQHQLTPFSGNFPYHSGHPSLTISRTTQATRHQPEFYCTHSAQAGRTWIFFHAILMGRPWLEC